MNLQLQKISKLRAARLARAVAIVYALATPALCQADEIFYNITQAEYPSTNQRKLKKSTPADATPVGTIADSLTGPRGSVSAFVSYGEIDAEVHGHTDSAGHSGSYGASMHWVNTITITPNDANLNGQPGKAILTYSAKGSFVIGAHGRGIGSWTLDLPNGVEYAYNGYNQFFDISTLGTITDQVDFTFGQPLQLEVDLIALSGSSSDVDFSLILSQTSLTITDSNGNPVGYSATSVGGTAGALPVPSGQPYNGFSLTNTSQFAAGSTLSLLDGTASSNSYVQAEFTAPPPAQDGAIAVSDAVNLKGTQSDPVVVQLSFNPGLAQSIFGGLSKLGLGWFDPALQIVRNAVFGNSSGAPTFVNGPYDPAMDFHLGYFGVDTAHGVAWAVVNHNSEFVVTNLDTLTVPSVTHLANSHMFLKLSGVANAVNRVEASPDLSAGSWSTVATVTAGPTGTVSYEDSTAGTQVRRFYRVSSP